MPPLPIPSDEYLGQVILGPSRQLGAQGQQQNKTIVNAQGQPVINEGLIPGSDPAAYGWQFLDPSTGIQRMFVGEDGTGNAYVAFCDASGNITVKIDSSGFHVLNASGQEEARLGQLSTLPAIYGLGVAPSTGSAPGTLQQVGGALFASSQPYVTTTAQYPGGADLGVSVTAEIGPSGQALGTWLSEINITNNAAGGLVTALIDGAASGATTADLYIATGGGQATVGNVWLFNGLSPGTHTFTLLGSAWNPTGVEFDTANLMIQPL